MKILENPNMTKMNDNLELNNKTTRSIALFCLISAIIITLIHNTNINFYLKDIVIPFTIMIIDYLVLIYKNKLNINKKAFIFLIPIILILASDPLIKIDISNKLLNVLILPFLISSFFLLLTNVNYKITKESFLWIFKLFPAKFFKNIKYTYDSLYTNDQPKTKFIFNIIIGLIIGIPLAVLILSLLTNADMYFNQFIGFILTYLFKLLNTGDIFINIIITIIAFTILMTIFLNIVRNKSTSLSTIKYYKVNKVISITILTILNLVFLLFLISEISKLTVNFLNLPIKYTYALYAREGFFQLLIVTTINFAIISYYTYCTNALDDKSLIKKLVLVLIGFSVLLVFNSYYRMFLYLGAYGLTILRLQVILFLTMELLIFLVLIKKIIFQLKHNDALIFTSILIIFYLLNLYLCNDYIINLIS